MSNFEDLNQLALKAVTTISTLGASVLQPGYFDQYVKEATQNRTILNDARQIRMESQVQNIDRVGFGSRITQIVAENTDISTSSEPTFAQNVLTAKEYVAMTSLTDQASRRTLEAPNFESSVVSMFAEQAGIDWEERAVFGDTTKYTGGGDGGNIPALRAQDGWIKRADADQLIYGTGAGKDFDYAEDGIIGAINACRATYPQAYMNNPGEVSIYMGFDYFDAYVDEWGERYTPAGDEALSSGVARPFKGHPVKYAPVLDSAAGVAAYDPAIIMVNPSNMVYGIFQDVTIEPDRVPKARRTDWVLAAETDQDFENEEAVVVCFPAETSP
ncbi:MAG: hypothetical protein Q8M92_10460 [Candidatus Subteraquimicrobiales bacterium]|nr:hypothetical protein [Candidatus Subteraquimicrobiales bacterium]